MRTDLGPPLGLLGHLHCQGEAQPQAQRAQSHCGNSRCERKEVSGKQMTSFTRRVGRGCDGDPQNDRSTSSFPEHVSVSQCGMRPCRCHHSTMLRWDTWITWRA